MLQQAQTLQTKQIIPSRIRTKYGPLTDRIWFPYARGESKERLYFYLGKLNAHPQGLFVAVKSTEIQDVLSSEKQLNGEMIFDLLVNAPSLVLGHIIPTNSLNSLDKTWVYGGDALQIAVAAATRVMLDVRHFEGHGSVDTLKSLETGKGQCFQRASLLTAALRMNNIPARVVGREDFFNGESEATDHWWVEAYLENKWVKFDPHLVNKIIELIPSIVAAGIGENISLFPTDASHRAEKVQNRIVPVEFGMECLKEISKIRLNRKER